jgi:hypothetical protein
MKEQVWEGLALRSMSTRRGVNPFSHFPFCSCSASRSNATTVPPRLVNACVEESFGAGKGPAATTDTALKLCCTPVMPAK